MKIIYEVGKDVKISTTKNELKQAYTSLDRLRGAIILDRILKELGLLFALVYDEDKEEERNEKED